MKKQKHTPTQKPADLSKLSTAIQFIVETGEASLTSSNLLPDREALQWAVRLLPYAATEVIAAETIEDRERALAKALLHAFTIGSYGTKSDNAKSVGAGSARRGAAKKHEPTKEKMRAAIAAAERLYPFGAPGRIGKIDANVAETMGVGVKTASRHRKNITGRLQKLTR